MHFSLQPGWASHDDRFTCLRTGEAADQLRELAPDEPEPGTQASHHLSAVGDVGVTVAREDGASAVVVHADEAFVFGEPDPSLAATLVSNGFTGRLHGAWASLDVRPMASGSHRSRITDWVAVVLDEIPDHEPPGVDELDFRPLRESDRELLDQLPGGGWVLSLWPDPIAATYALVLATDDQILALGGPRTLSDRYAEYGAWVHPDLVSKGVAPAATTAALTHMVADGVVPCGIIRRDNAAALMMVTKIGCRVVRPLHVVELRR